MFNRILVSVIGSAQCERVLKLAIGLSQPSSIINIVYVVDSIHSDDQWREHDVANAELHAAQACISGFCAWVTSKGFECAGKIVSGDIVNELSRHASAMGSEVIVMGHQHMTLLERWFGVSVVTGILEAAPCPVLVEVR